MTSRMSSTLFVPYQLDQRFQYLVHPADMYHQLYSNSVPISQPSSFVRSSAQDIPTPPPQQQAFYPDGYPQPSAVEAYQEELSSSVSSTSSIGLAASLDAQDYAESNYAFTATAAAQPYQFETIPRSIPWAKEEQLSCPPLNDAGYDASGRYLESQLYQPSYFEKSQGQYTPPQLSSYYHTPEPVMSQEPTLAAYTAHDTPLPSVVFSGSPRLNGHGMVHDQPGSPASSYGMGSSPHVQYASTPERGINPQFVSLQDVSPSPTVSPDQGYSNLPSPSASKQQLYDYVVAEPVQSSGDDDSSASDVSSTPVAPRRTIKTRTAAPPRKRARTEHGDDSESRVSLSDSGESEREDDGDDADDDDYQPEHGEPSRSSRRKTSSASRSVGARSESPFTQRSRVPPPVPVPNLTKKSRGRRVPTAAAQEDAEEKAKRGYKCKVAGCNKLFQRGEHLKRHVRSIHTNEKPHRCPYKHCGKDFSRHDNLRQHMRVHRNDPLDSEGTAGSA